MDHITFVPSPEQFAFTFGGAEPVLRIKAPTVLTLWTEDAYSGRITSADDIASSALDTEDLNPQTGPFWIEGAEPGEGGDPATAVPVYLRDRVALKTAER